MLTSMCFYTLAILTLIQVTFGAIGPIADLKIVNKIISPDGFPRSTVLADGTFPGPLMRGFKGDRFKINIVDELVDDSMERSTTIHWHGLFQHGTNYNDGAAFVTQCPIIPKNSYQYNFEVPDQAGTYWYHSHMATQYCDGLRGPLVIYDPLDPHSRLYDVDDESTIITLADWYHVPSSQVPLPIIADSTLINGHGRYTGGPPSPLSVVNVRSGKRYRFRLVSMACDSFFTFSIDGHNMTIIEADGVNTEPLTVDSLQIFAAQRYSLIVHAKEKGGNFWIRAEQRPGPDGGPIGFAGGINSAILRYAGAPKVDPTTTQTPSVIPLVEANLHPLINPRAPGQPHPGGADVLFNLNIGTTDQGRFTINNVSFIPPSVPVLLQILSGSTQASQLLPKGSVFPLPPNKVVEISIPALGVVGGPHPFHLHGHTFSVIRSAGTGTYNYVNPIQRDVVSIGGNNGGTLADNVTIRFVTDNTGPWFLHCHIDFHLNLGLGIVFPENVNDTTADDRVTPAWKELCPAYSDFISSSQRHSPKKVLR